MLLQKECQIHHEITARSFLTRETNYDISIPVSSWILSKSDNRCLKNWWSLLIFKRKFRIRLLYDLKLEYNLPFQYILFNYVWFYLYFDNRRKLYLDKSFPGYHILHRMWHKMFFNFKEVYCTPKFCFMKNFKDRHQTNICGKYTYYNL